MALYFDMGKLKEHSFADLYHLLAATGIGDDDNFVISFDYAGLIVLATG